MNDTNNNVEKIDRDLYAVDFNSVAMGQVDGMRFIDTPEEAKSKIVCTSRDGCFIINKPLDNADFQHRISLVKAIMQIKLPEINTEHGFYEWIRKASQSLEKYSDESLLKLRDAEQYKEFWYIYQNLSEAESNRRSLRKKWLLSHPLVLLEELLNDKGCG